MVYVTVLDEDYRSLPKLLEIAFLDGIKLAEVELENPKSSMLLRPKTYKSIDIKVRKPILRTDECESCGACVYTCPKRAILWKPPEKPDVIEEICDGCLVCYYVCYPHAIKVEEVNVGCISVYHYGKGEIYAIPVLECCEHHLMRTLLKSMDEGVLYFYKNYPVATALSIDVSNAVVVLYSQELGGYLRHYVQFARELGKEIIKINIEKGYEELRHILDDFFK